MKRSFQIFVIGALVAALTTLAFAAVPPMINYQGKLAKPSGAPLDTTTSMVFCIYADPITLNPLWCDTQSAVVVEKGVFNVLLGSQHPIPDSVFDGNVRYLGVKVGNDAEITPRKPMVSVGYAYKSFETDTADYARVAPPIPDNDWIIEGDTIYHLNGNVGIGTTNPGTLLTLSTVETGNATALTMGFGNRYGIGFNGEGAGHFNIFAHQTAIGIGIGFDTGDYGTFSEKVTIQNDGRVGIGTTDPQVKLDVEGNVQAYAFNVGDIFFQKDKEKLWRMYEDEDGLYLENLKTGKIYRFVLQEAEKK
jgi:hypothetical protein